MLPDPVFSDDVDALSNFRDLLSRGDEQGVFYSLPQGVCLFLFLKEQHRFACFSGSCHCQLFAFAPAVIPISAADVSSAGHAGIFVGCIAYIALFFCHPPTTYTHPSKTSENDPLTPLPLWWTAALTGILVLAVFGGVVTIRPYRDETKQPAGETVHFDGPQARLDTDVVVDQTKVKSDRLKMIFLEHDSDGKVARNSDGTFTLDDGETYYLFRNSKFSSNF